MEIRHSLPADVDRMMDIYAGARAFMARTGNPNQWGPTNWPPRALIEQDIRQGKSYVCVHEGRVIGTFFLDFGPDIESTYVNIEDGAWGSQRPYGVIHRLAGDGSVRGTGEFCIRWAMERFGHLRVDTHGDNKVMQGILTGMGFVHRGTIYVEEDNYPRLAYDIGT